MLRLAQSKQHGSLLGSLAATSFVREKQASTANLRSPVNIQEPSRCSAYDRRVMFREVCNLPESLQELPSHVVGRYKPLETYPALLVQQYWFSPDLQPNGASFMEQPWKDSSNTGASYGCYHLLVQFIRPTQHGTTCLDSTNDLGSQSSS